MMLKYLYGDLSFEESLCLVCKQTASPSQKYQAKS